MGALWPPCELCIVRMCSARVTCVSTKVDGLARPPPARSARPWSSARGRRATAFVVCMYNMGTLSCPYGRAGGVGVRKLATISSTRCVRAGVT
jgi:hypothetical protein